MAKEEAFPKFFNWLFRQWSFWVIFVLWEILSIWGEFKDHSIIEHLGILLGNYIVVILVYLGIYFICKSTFKKIN